MSRISTTFEAKNKQGKKVLSPYITAGDPSIETTVPLLHALVDAGADIIELGMPFSDPMAEGPVIQAAMERALNANTKMHDVFAMVKQFRESNKDTPIVLMGYLNPIEMMGYEAFAKTCAESGVDGLIIVDLPPEEAHDLHAALTAQHIDLIFLMSPTTTEARVKLITQLASGYIYYVSLKGVTGSGQLNTDDVAAIVAERKQYTSLPIVVGFGIKTADDAARISQQADGVVVGSALVQLFAEHQQVPEKIKQQAQQLLQSMRLEMDKTA